MQSSPLALLQPSGTCRRDDRTRRTLDAPRFGIAAESAYLLGFINSPHSYEIGAQFITARAGGIVEGDSWLRGYNQFYFSAVAEPIFRGIENDYFGINFGLRYNFVRPNSRFVPYVSGGVGLGWIDSHANIPGAQGQDFTFNIMSAVGVSQSIERPLEAQRRRGLSTPFQRRTNRSESESQSDRAADRTNIFVLISSGSFLPCHPERRIPHRIVEHTENICVARAAIVRFLGASRTGIRSE